MPWPPFFPYIPTPPAPEEPFFSFWLTTPPPVSNSAFPKAPPGKATLPEWQARRSQQQQGEGSATPHAAASSAASDNSSGDDARSDASPSRRSLTPPREGKGETGAEGKAQARAEPPKAGGGVSYALAAAQSPKKKEAARGRHPPGDAGTGAHVEEKPRVQ